MKKAEITIKHGADWFFNATDLVSQWNKILNTSFDINSFIRGYISDEAKENMMYEKDGSIYLHCAVEPQLRFEVAAHDTNIYNRLNADIIVRTIVDRDIVTSDKIDESIRKSTYKTYLMCDEASGAIKIGRAYDPQFRKHTLCAQIPRIKLLAVCQKDVENQLHEEYKAKRMRGEWFNLSQKDVNNIIKRYDFTRNERDRKF